MLTYLAASAERYVNIFHELCALIVGWFAAIKFARALCDILERKELVPRDN